MTLTVEDGTGLAAADAFISLAYAAAYHAARGNTAWAAGTVTDDAREQAIRRATTFLSIAFTWQGFKVRARSQALAWPRSFVQDGEGNTVANDEVPDEVEQATAEAALRELATAGALTPDYTPSERVSQETVGPISITYDLSRTDTEATRPIMLIVRDLIGPLLAAGGGSQVAGRTVRV